MAFDRLSLPIPEDLLVQSALRADDFRRNRQSPKEAGDEYSRLVQEFEYHSARAAEAAKKIHKFLDREGPEVLDGSRDGHAVCRTKHAAYKTRVDDDSDSCLGIKYKTQVSTLSKAFARKPRSLLRVSADEFVATALDGTAALWSYKHRGKSRQFNLSANHLPQGAALSGDRVYFVEQPVVEGTGRESIRSKVSQHSLATGQKQREIYIEAHTRPITCILSIGDDLLVTGSEDHSVVVGSAAIVGHSAAVAALCHFPENGTVYSAGMDGRINCIDLSVCRNVGTRKHQSHRFCWLHTCPHHVPHTIIAQQQSSSEQFLLIDTRVPSSPSSSLFRFGWSEQGNVSRFVRASWRPSGEYLLCGTQSPSSGPHSALNLFDLRKTLNGPCWQLAEAEFRERRWLECCFLDNGSAAANATDGALSFLNMYF